MSHEFQLLEPDFLVNPFHLPRPYKKALHSATLRLIFKHNVNHNFWTPARKKKLI